MPRPRRFVGRVAGDADWHEEGRLWMFRAVAPLSDWYFDFPPASPFRCEVWYDPSRDVATLARVIDDPLPAAELTHAADPLNRIIDTPLGRMVLDARLRRWSTPVEWLGDELIVSIQGEPDGPDAAGLRIAGDVIADARRFDELARAAFTTELFSLQHDGWTEEPVSAEQFASRPRATDLQVWEAWVELWYADERSFTDHGVRVALDTDGTVRQVALEG